MRKSTTTQEHDAGTSTADLSSESGDYKQSPSAKKELTTGKPRCGGLWTEARYNSFIKSALRTASVRWPPRYQALHDAFITKGVNPATGRVAKLYSCPKCKGTFTAANMEVNHIVPVVPVDGFDNWDNVIERLFCEKDGLEAICKPCHKKITAFENQQRKENKKNGKQ